MIECNCGKCERLLKEIEKYKAEIKEPSKHQKILTAVSELLDELKIIGISPDWGPYSDVSKILNEINDDKD